MVTALSGCHAYIFDWSEADAADYDLEDGTEGTNWCKLPLPTLIQSTAEQDGLSILYFGGDGYLFRYDRTKRIIRIVTKCETRAELGLIDKFFSKRQSAETDPDYLVVCFDASDYLPAYDENGTDQNGVFRGWFKKIPLLGWTENESNTHDLQVEFHVVWG